MAVVTALSGTRKAAILVLAMGEEAAGEMFKHLHEDEVEKIAKEVAALGPVNSDAGERVLEEFAHYTASVHVARQFHEVAWVIIVDEVVRSLLKFFHVPV